MRYVLLIYGVEAEYANMTPDEHAILMQGHAAFAEETQQSKQLVGGAPLKATSTAKSVRVRKGKAKVTDGPFAETKEQLGGIYILDCKTWMRRLLLPPKSRMPNTAASKCALCLNCRIRGGHNVSGRKQYHH